MIEFFIFNYGRFDNAKQLLSTFQSLGFDSYIINCASDKDPEFEETDFIKKLPNVYWTGQWNKMLEIASKELIFIVNSDVEIPDPKLLIDKCLNFYQHPRSGIYAPNINHTDWEYDEERLDQVLDGCKIVVGTDSSCWSLRREIATAVGEVDLSINKLGWGIEILAAYYATTVGLYVVRDYSVLVKHPRSSAYSHQDAVKQQEAMFRHLGLGKSFDMYYNSRKFMGFKDKIYYL